MFEDYATDIATEGASGTVTVEHYVGAINTFRAVISKAFTNLSLN